MSFQFHSAFHGKVTIDAPTLAQVKVSLAHRVQFPRDITYTLDRNGEGEAFERGVSIGHIRQDNR